MRILLITILILACSTFRLEAAGPNSIDAIPGMTQAASNFIRVQTYKDRLHAENRPFRLVAGRIYFRILQKGENLFAMGPKMLGESKIGRIRKVPEHSVFKFTL